MITTITPRESVLAAIASDYQHEALAWSVTSENLEQSTITRLQGEAKVMVSLLAGAVAVLQTIEPECATEAEDLNQLREGIWAVLSAVAKRGGA